MQAIDVGDKIAAGHHQHMCRSKMHLVVYYSISFHGNLMSKRDADNENHISLGRNLEASLHLPAHHFDPLNRAAFHL